MARTWRTSPRPLWRSLNTSSLRGLKFDVSSRVYTFNPDQNHTCNPEASCCFLYPRISSRHLLLEAPMSTREMMSQGRRTVTMSGLRTAGEASSAEIIVPVGGDEVVMSTGSGSTSCSWLPSKPPMGRVRTLAEAVICWGESVVGVAPFLSTIAHRRARQGNWRALSLPSLIYSGQVHETPRADNQKFRVRTRSDQTWWICCPCIRQWTRSVSTVSALLTPLAVPLRAKFTTYVFCEQLPPRDSEATYERQAIALFPSRILKNYQNSGH
jgi:hypothetical protein